MLNGRPKEHLSKKMNIFQRTASNTANIGTNTEKSDNPKTYYTSLLNVLDSLDAAVYVTDIKTHELIFINQYIRNIFGDIEGKTCWQVLQSGQSGPCNFCTNDKLIDSEGKPKDVYQWEFQNTINGRWYDIRDRAIEWMDGRIVRLEIATDITDRKTMEQTLSGQKEFLKNIFNSIQDGIGILDKDMTITQVNTTLEQWYAHAMPLVGKKCYEAYHNLKKPCNVCPVQETLKTGKTAYEVVPKTGPDGKDTGWMSLYSFPMFDTDTKDIKGIIEYARDITELRKMEDEIKNRVNELEEFYQIAINRELRIKKLREEIERLNIELVQYKKQPQ
jgi:PAS domain S-box-containing protein